MQLLLLLLALVLVTALAQHTLPSKLVFKGINLSGPEYGVDQWANGTIPGTPGRTYRWPAPAYDYFGIDYFANKGMNIFRIPFRWERIQPALGGPLDAAEFTRMKTTVRGLTARNVYVYLDMHNYMRYHLPSAGRYNDIGRIGEGAVTIAYFEDIWRRLAAEFKDDTRVIFALNNEPHDCDTIIYYQAIQAAINAVRSTGARNYVAVMGTHWGGALNYYPQSAMNDLLTIHDPNGNILWDAHLYMNIDNSGGTADCISETIGVERATRFTNWLIANNQVGIISEFGAGTSATCAAATDNLLQHMEENADYYAGWIWWDAGPGSITWADHFKIEPVNGQDTPQMSMLLPHMNWQPASGKPIIPIPPPVIAPPPAPAPVPAKAPAAVPATTCKNQLYSQCGGAHFGGEVCCPSGQYCKPVSNNWSECTLGTAAASAVAPAPAGTSPVKTPTTTCTNVKLSKCGGKHFTGPKCCPAGYKCTYANEWWSDCQPLPATKTVTESCKNGPLNRCGGIHFTGTTCCPTGYACTYANAYWSDCQKVTAGGASPNVAFQPPASVSSLYSCTDDNSNDEWEQCGGEGYVGSECCKAGYACKVYNTYWSYCATKTNAIAGFDEAAPPTQLQLDTLAIKATAAESAAHAAAALAAAREAAISATEGINLDSTGNYQHHSMTLTQPN